MKRVIIESPFAGLIRRNTEYARRCLEHSLSLGEAPFASHLLYTQVYDDTIPALRQVGITAGFAWVDVADLVAFYVDYGWSSGMNAAWDRWWTKGGVSGLATTVRRIGKNP